jgi:hypothetical protein
VKFATVGLRMTALARLFYTLAAADPAFARAGEFGQMPEPFGPTTWRIFSGTAWLKVAFDDWVRVDNE